MDLTSLRPYQVQLVLIAERDRKGAGKAHFHILLRNDMWARASNQVRELGSLFRSRIDGSGGVYFHERTSRMLNPSDRMKYQHVYILEFKSANVNRIRMRHTVMNEEYGKRHPEDKAFCDMVHSKFTEDFDLED